MFLLLFCALMLVLLWLFQTVFLTDMYKYIRKQEIAHVITIVEQEIETTDLQTLILNIQDVNDIMITPTRDFVPPQRPRQDTQSGRVPSPPFDTITETKEFTRNDGQTISLTFYALISPVNATISTLRMQLLVITIVMVLFSVILAIFIAKRVSKPIEEINRGANALAKGDYSTRFYGKGFYEIVELSETLNTAAAELGKVESLRRELLANVSHDLRTPLSLIYSNAEMMNDFPGEVTPNQTKLIMDETQRLTTLVNDVLDISKLESDMEQLNISHFSLTENILRTTMRVEELLRSEDYDISFECYDEVYVDADEIKIGRAFYNLLINAVNYSDDCRTITIDQTVTGNRVKISVTDHGEGIVEDDLPYIWDRYYRSGKTHKRAVTGTGLGLSIVKRILELHGGRYGVSSELGKGSTFWFEIKTPDG